MQSSADTGRGAKGACAPQPRAPVESEPPFPSIDDEEPAELDPHSLSALASHLLQVRRLRMAEFDACVLMSDGSEASLLERPSGRFAPALETLHGWAASAEPAAFERALADNLRGVLRRRTIDDVSLALVLERRSPR